MKKDTPGHKRPFKKTDNEHTALPKFPRRKAHTAPKFPNRNKDENETEEHDDDDNLGNSHDYRPKKQPYEGNRFQKHLQFGRKETGPRGTPRPYTQQANFSKPNSQRSFKRDDNAHPYKSSFERKERPHDDSRPYKPPFERRERSQDDSRPYKPPFERRERSQDDSRPHKPPFERRERSQDDSSFERREKPRSNFKRNENRPHTPSHEHAEKSAAPTSWEPVNQWYNDVVGDDGHYYHQNIILPGVLRLLNLKASSRETALIDFCCGQGVLARQLPTSIKYFGVDASSSLIAAANKGIQHDNCLFLVHDVTQPMTDVPHKAFSHATIMLALQNIAAPDLLLKNAAEHLKKHGSLVIVLNHPCFRIPRQSSWQQDTENQTQYRRIDRYMTPMQIPIQAHPGKGETSETTTSFHWPLHTIANMLHEAGFVIETIEEWISDKVSDGKYAKMENRARNEFPLFMAIKAQLLK